MNHQRQDEDNRHHFVSPISASSPEYGNFYGGFPHEHNPPEVNGRFPHNYNPLEVNGGFPYDDGLPEVRVDNSPQALSNLEAEYKWRHFEEREPKYPVVYDDTLKTAIPAQTSLQYEPAAAAEQTPGAAEPLTPTQEKTIFGLKRKIFFLVLATLIILIIVAGVGGGVGGSVSHSKSNTPVLVVVDNVTVSSSSSSSLTAASITSKTSLSSSSSTTITTTTSSTTPTPTITFLNNQTTPTTTFSFQGFSKFNYEGNATSIIHAEGGTNFAFEINSYVWLPNTTSCCLSFCVNATTQGGNAWWCDERYQNNSSAPFDRVFVWCGEARTDANAVCA